MRRNRLAVVAALLVAFSLVGGIVATSIQAHRAERRFEVARQLAKAVVADIKGPLERLPGATAVRASMIQTVLRYLDGLAQDPGRDPLFELEIADTYRVIAGVEGHPLQQNLGQAAAALNHYQNAITIYEKHANRAETRSRALTALIGTTVQAGDIEIRNGHAAAAQARLQRLASLASEAAARDATVVSPDAWIYLYFRLGDVEYRRGAAGQALPYYRKALEISKSQAIADGSAMARSTLRGAWVRLADAQKESGDLYGARESYLIALRAAEETMRLPDARVYDRSMLAYGHQCLGAVLGNPDEPNLGDRSGALSHARTGVDVAETVAVSDQQDVRARDDLSVAYRTLGAILLPDRPKDALKWYDKAARISKELNAADPSSTKFRYNFAFAQMGIGESLHRLAKNREALQNLSVALEMMKSLTDAAQDQVYLIGELGRIHQTIGNVQAAMGDGAGALENYRQALAATADLTRRAPSSVYLRRQYADALESLGQYYGMLARRRRELKAEARLWLQKSLAVWQELKRRNIAAPYTKLREAQVTMLIASIDKM